VLDNDDLKKVSKLARLRIEDSEQTEFLRKLNGVFEWIEQLSAIDVSEVNLDDDLEETDSSHERADESQMTNTREELLSNTQHKKFDMFCVPKILEVSEGS
jgi:aspartyl-tRNA(Asn)/glutamyl-tRNA(Gln) amidotransferase subunit C